MRGTPSVLVGLLSFAATGCSYPEPSLDSPDPAARIPAIVAAAERRDWSAVQGLIESLDSQDPAVRFAAIKALERITGERLGYDYAAAESERKERVQAWVDWYQRRSGTRATDPLVTAERSGGGR